VGAGVSLRRKSHWRARRALPKECCETGKAQGEAKFEPEVLERSLAERKPKVMDTIEAHESASRHRVVENLGQTSPYPRVLPLRDLLKARV
jgi:hypothetical protein